MPRFYTPFFATDYALFPYLPATTRSWTASLGARDNSSAIFVDTSGGTRRYDARQIVLTARSHRAAEEAAWLIYASLAAVDAGLALAVQHDDVTTTDPRLVAQRDHRSHFPVACEIARRAVRRTSYKYALAKLWLSYHIASTPLMDLEPHMTGWVAAKSSNVFDQVRLAYAIVLANGVIEELGLDVRGTRERPSRRTGGEWNPPVLADLEARLRKARIPTDEPFLWTRRGRQTRLEAARSMRVANRVPWTRWPNVRDALVPLADAIAHVEWMRDKVTAHKTPPAFWRVLSIYDVSNAQSLARNLLLSALQAWPLFMLKPGEVAPTLRARRRKRGLRAPSLKGSE